MDDNKKTEITECLREQTRRLHLQAHKLSFFKALLKGDLNIESYVGQLRMLAIIHETLEHETATSKNKALSVILNGYMPKLPLLLDDLKFFEHQNIREIAPAVQLANAVAEKIRQRKQDQPESLIGYLYTLEGSTMGGRIIKPHIAKAFNLDDSGGLLFFSSYGENVKSNWQGFLNRMEQVISEEMQEDIISASSELFNELIHIYELLHPV